MLLLPAASVVVTVSVVAPGESFDKIERCIERTGRWIEIDRRFRLASELVAQLNDRRAADIDIAFKR